MKAEDHPLRGTAGGKAGAAAAFGRAHQQRAQRHRIEVLTLERAADAVGLQLCLRRFAQVMQATAAATSEEGADRRHAVGARPCRHRFD
ncbi:hypothetical protein, partial [Elstera litoralis]|uniref:hypothetical protein n=1 Tax=Elstera litoralis TaxID=552518 RepID=UPI0012EEBC85